MRLYQINCCHWQKSPDCCGWRDQSLETFGVLKCLRATIAFSHTEAFREMSGLQCMSESSLHHMHDETNSWKTDKMYIVLIFRTSPHPSLFPPCRRPPCISVIAIHAILIYFIFLKILSFAFPFFVHKWNTTIDSHFKCSLTLPRSTYDMQIYFCRFISGGTE